MDHVCPERDFFSRDRDGSADGASGVEGEVPAGPDEEGENPGILANGSFHFPGEFQIFQSQPELEFSHGMLLAPEGRFQEVNDIFRQSRFGAANHLDNRLKKFGFAYHDSRFN
jgi:hypothetical protein